MSIDAKMLGEIAWLEQKVSALTAERESLVVLNASLAEKNKILHAKLTTLMNARDDLHATLREALGLMEVAAAKEQEEALQTAAKEQEEALQKAAASRGGGRARAEEWAALRVQRP
jgi:peptidoglycan hydrolase CwlO-like protein